MITQAAVDQMDDPMQNPLALCEKLGLIPTDKQHGMLLQLAECPKIYEDKLDADFQTARAGALFALWRVLSISGSTGIVLTPTQALGASFMNFMEAVTTRTSPELASVSGFPRWNVLQIGGRTAWELRLMPNKAPLVAEKAPNSVVSLILEASNTDVEFVEAVKALEEHSTHPKNVLIRLW